MNDKVEHARIDAEIARVGPSNDPFAAAVRATRMPMLITDPNQPDNPIVYANAAFTKLTGYSQEEIIGKNCRFLQGPNTNKDDVERIRHAIERRVAIELDLINHKKNGETFWNRLLISPVFDGDGHLTYFFASQFDVTLEKERLVKLEQDRNTLEDEAERRTLDLARSESQLKFILKAGRLGSWSLDLEDLRLVASDVCKANYGRLPSDPFTYADLINTVAPEDRQRMQDTVRQSIDEHADYDIEYRIVTPAGDVKYIQVRGQTYYRADGQPLSMAGVSIDITDRREAEEHRKLLTDELNHRVKNSMATMQSIVHQTLRVSANLEDARHALDSRMVSLSEAHDFLTRENWDRASLADIVDSTMKPFISGDSRRLVRGGPTISLPPKSALSLVMALHELATNAVKYGAWSNDEGRVIINWDIHDQNGQKLFDFHWLEVDGPSIKPPTRKGFGSRMIEKALAGEFGGKSTVNYRARGLEFSMTAPLPVSIPLIGQLKR